MDIYKRFVLHQPPESKRIKAGVNNLRFHMEYIDWIVERNNYLVGSELSLADISAAAQLSVIDYLGNILASGYEDAKMKGQVKSFWDYELRPKKIPMSGSLFDMKKLEWWAKEYIAKLPVDELVGDVVNWANKYGNDDVRHEYFIIQFLGLFRDHGPVHFAGVCIHETEAEQYRNGRIA